MKKLDGTADCKSDVGSYQMPMLADPLSQEIRDGIRLSLTVTAPLGVRHPKIRGALFDSGLNMAQN